jgi:hypothetical protein
MKILFLTASRSVYEMWHSRFLIYLVCVCMCVCVCVCV